MIDRLAEAGRVEGVADQRNRSEPRNADARVKDTVVHGSLADRRTT